MDIQGSLVKTLSTDIASKRIVDEMLISAGTILVYDWLLNLPREVEYIWRASWKWTKVLYLLARYTPFVSTALMLQIQLSWNPSLESCRVLTRAMCWLAILAVDLAEIILAVRTYAVWNRDKRVGIGLAVLLAIGQIPNVIVIERFINTLKFTQNPIPALYRGCVFSEATKLVVVNWAVFVTIDGVVLVLMVISALKTYSRHSSHLSDVVYVDGIMFYPYIFCVAMVNILITILLPIAFVGVGSSLEVVLHSVLSCRLMIGMREASQQASERKLESFELPKVHGDNFVQLERGSPQVSGVDGVRSLRGTIRDLVCCR